MAGFRPPGYGYPPLYPPQGPPPVQQSYYNAPTNYGAYQNPAQSSPTQQDAPQDMNASMPHVPALDANSLAYFWNSVHAGTIPPFTPNGSQSQNPMFGSPWVPPPPPPSIPNPLAAIANPFAAMAQQTSQTPVLHTPTLASWGNPPNSTAQTPEQLPRSDKEDGEVTDTDMGNTGRTHPKGDNLRKQSHKKQKGKGKGKSNGSQSFPSQSSPVAASTFAQNRNSQALHHLKGPSQSNSTSTPMMGSAQTAQLPPPTVDKRAAIKAIVSKLQGLGIGFASVVRENIFEDQDRVLLRELYLEAGLPVDAAQAPVEQRLPQQLPGLGSSAASKSQIPGLSGTAVSTTQNHGIGNTNSPQSQTRQATEPQSTEDKRSVFLQRLAAARSKKPVASSNSPQPSQASVLAAASTTKAATINDIAIQAGPDQPAVQSTPRPPVAPVNEKKEPSSVVRMAELNRRMELMKQQAAQNAKARPTMPSRSASLSSFDYTQSRDSDASELIGDQPLSSAPSFAAATGGVALHNAPQERAAPQIPGLSTSGVGSNIQASRPPVSLPLLTPTHGQPAQQEQTPHIAPPSDSKRVAQGSQELKPSVANSTQRAPSSIPLKRPAPSQPKPIVFASSKHQFGRSRHHTENDRVIIDVSSEDDDSDMEVDQPTRGPSYARAPQDNNQQATSRPQFGSNTIGRPNVSGQPYQHKYIAPHTINSAAPVAPSAPSAPNSLSALEEQKKALQERIERKIQEEKQKLQAATSASVTPRPITDTVSTAVTEPSQNSTPQPALPQSGQEAASGMSRSADSPARAVSTSSLTIPRSQSAEAVRRRVAVKSSKVQEMQKQMQLLAEAIAREKAELESELNDLGIDTTGWTHEDMQDCKDNLEMKAEEELERDDTEIQRATDVALTDSAVAEADHSPRLSNHDEEEEGEGGEIVDEADLPLSVRNADAVVTAKLSSPVGDEALLGPKSPGAISSEASDAMDTRDPDEIFNLVPTPSVHDSDSEDMSEDGATEDLASNAVDMMDISAAEDQESMSESHSSSESDSPLIVEAGGFTASADSDSDEEESSDEAEAETFPPALEMAAQATPDDDLLSDHDSSDEEAVESYAPAAQPPIQATPNQGALSDEGEDSSEDDAEVYDPAAVNAVQATSNKDLDADEASSDADMADIYEPSRDPPGTTRNEAATADAGASSEDSDLDDFYEPPAETPPAAAHSYQTLNNQTLNAKPEQAENGSAVSDEDDSIEFEDGEFYDNDDEPDPPAIHTSVQSTGASPVPGLQSQSPSAATEAGQVLMDDVPGTGNDSRPGVSLATSGNIESENNLASTELHADQASEDGEVGTTASAGSEGPLPENSSIADIEVNGDRPELEVPELQPPRVNVANGTVPSIPSQLTPFTPYESPLKMFKAYRVHAQFPENVSGGYQSLTYSHTIHPDQPLCPSEMTGGTCNDPNCSGQHFGSMQLPDSHILVQLGTVKDGLSAEDRDRWSQGLGAIIADFRANNITDTAVIAARIARYRREFFGDPSRILDL